MRDLSALPKAHLHVHLEGAMRPSTLRDLAGKYGMEVPASAGTEASPVRPDLYVAACEVLRTLEDLRPPGRRGRGGRCAAGAVWIEPSSYLPHHRLRLGPDQEVIDIVLDALAAAAAALASEPRSCRLPTGRSPLDAIEQARLAAANAGRGSRGIRAGQRRGDFPPEPFAEPFAIARQAGLLSTPHAGELAGPASVLGAIDYLGADRIQHGVRAIEDPELMERLADSAVCLDVCPTSNVLLSVYPSLEAHPLPALLDAGIRCSLNGDDPLLFGPGLLEEYELCRSDLGLDDGQLAFIARCSIEASGAPKEIKDKALTGIDQWLAEPG